MKWGCCKTSVFCCSPFFVFISLAQRLIRAFKVFFHQSFHIGFLRKAQDGDVLRREVHIRTHSHCPNFWGGLITSSKLFFSKKLKAIVNCQLC